MPIFVALTLLPTLTFYFYVLVQFWREANRRRRHDTCATIVPLNSAHTREREEEYYPRALSGGGSGTAVKPKLAPISEFAAHLAEIEPPTRAAVVAAYLENRVAAVQSGTECLASRRIAKG